MDELSVQNLVVVSDTHAGDKLALCVDRLPIDFAGGYDPSPFQRSLWSFWREFHDEFVPWATGRKKHLLLHNGDIVEGCHHRSKTAITQDMHVQRAIAGMIMEREVDRAKLGTVFVAGTPAHAGENWEDEKTVAQSLGGIPFGPKDHLHPEAWLRVGDALVHACHHVSAAGRQASEASALVAEMAEEFQAAAKLGEAPPDVVIRSHRHANIEANGPTMRGRWYSFATAAWQGKTPYVWKINQRTHPPQFGASVVSWKTNPWGGGHIVVNHYSKMVGRVKVITREIGG